MRLSPTRVAQDIIYNSVLTIDDFRNPASSTEIDIHYSNVYVWNEVEKRLRSFRMGIVTQFRLIEMSPRSSMRSIRPEWLNAAPDSFPNMILWTAINMVISEIYRLLAHEPAIIR